MTRAAIAVPALVLVWAGVAIGGSLIAAPAKFGAPTVGLPAALEIGREQFFWLGVAEGAACAALIGALVLRAAGALWWMWAPVAVFAVQRLVLMPLLDARTLRTIAGESVPDSNLHLVFVVLEFVKVAALVAAGIAALRNAPMPPSGRAS